MPDKFYWAVSCHDTSNISMTRVIMGIKILAEIEKSRDKDHTWKTDKYNKNIK